MWRARSATGGRATVAEPPAIEPRDAEPPASAPARPVRLRELLAVLIVVATSVGALIGALLALRAVVGQTAIRAHGGALIAAMTLWLAASLLLALWLVVIRRGQRRWSDLGLRRPDARMLHLAWQIPLSMAASATVAASVLTLAGSGASPRERLAPSGVELHPVAVTVIVLSTAVLVPIGEELLVRGALWSALRRRTGVATTLLITSVVFGLAHVAPAVIAYVLPLGFCLGLLRWWHGNVLAGIALHAVNNALVTATVISAL